MIPGLLPRLTPIHDLSPRELRLATSRACHNRLLNSKHAQGPFSTRSITFDGVIYPNSETLIDGAGLFICLLGATEDTAQELICVDVRRGLVVGRQILDFKLSKYFVGAELISSTQFRVAVSGERLLDHRFIETHIFSCHIVQSDESSAAVVWSPSGKFRAALGDEHEVTVSKARLLGNTLFFIQQSDDGSQNMAVLGIPNPDTGATDDFEVMEKVEVSVEIPLLGQPQVTPASFDQGCMAWRRGSACDSGMWLLSGPRQESVGCSEKVKLLPDRVEIGAIKVSNLLERVEVSGDHIWAIDQETLCVFEKQADDFIAHRVHGVDLGVFEAVDVDVGVVCIGGYRISGSRPVSCMDMYWYTPYY